MQQHELTRITAALPQELQPIITKVAPAEWATLRPGQRLIVRLKTSSTLLGGEVVSNKLDHRAAPTLEIRQLGDAGADTATLKRNQIRDIQRFSHQ